MIDTIRVQKYCSEDISLIENYQAAILDKTQTWDCHHRFEISENKSKKQLINEDRYYAVPANELIFLTKAEHTSLHFKGRISPMKGKVSPMKGKHHTAEARQKISEARKGTHLSAEHRQKLSTANKGKYRTEETRRKMSEARKAIVGKHYYNNGIKCIMAFECPGPEWKHGRIRKEKKS